MRRIVGAYGTGRIVNPKTTRSQCIGGMIGGIGMALMEHSVVDSRNGGCRTPISLNMPCQYTPTPRLSWT